MRADNDFLGLHYLGDGKHEFVVAPHLSRLDQRLYGGTAIAVSVATAEEVTERNILWMTTQFVSTVATGETMSVTTEILAPGFRTNQVRVTGYSPAGDVVFASLGATGNARPDGLTGEFEECPIVSWPDQSEVWGNPFVGMARLAGLEVPAFPSPNTGGFSDIVEIRHAAVTKHPDPGPGRLCLWARRVDREPITAATAAFIADMVPMSIAAAFGVLAGGTSLDNSIRVGHFVESEWVLIDLRPHFAAGDYGHGLAHVWSPDGKLLATASQTASLRQFDLDNIPWKTK